MKLAIVGFTDSWKDAPFEDASFRIWGMNRKYLDVPRWDRWFEIHDPAWLAEKYPHIWDQYEAWLARKDHPGPIYMADSYPQFPCSKRYPIEDVKARFGDYFTSTVTYMIAMALMEATPEDPLEELHVYGVNMRHDEEWAHQRPNAEYFLGICAGLGVKIYVPDTSALLKSPDGTLYAFGDAIDPGPWLEMEDSLRLREAGLAKQFAKATADKEAAIRAMLTFDGALQEVRYQRRQIRERQRGGVLPGLESQS